MRRPFLLLVFLSCCLTGYAQQKWVLKKDEDGIKVYTGSVPNTNIKSVKAELNIDATLSQLAAVMLDMKVHDQWVYNTKNTHTLAPISGNDLMYYSEVSMPWPFTNRDVVAELHIAQDPATKVMHVLVTGKPFYIPVNKDKIRLALLKITWEVTPINEHQLHVDYYVETDPGGAVPAWLVNMFSTKIPMETFKKLRQMVTMPAYKNARVDFIRD